MKNTSRTAGVLLILLTIALLCDVSCAKSGLRETERNLIQDVERFNRDYGSKGLTIKNKDIDWSDGLICDGLVLKNSLIKNVKLQTVKLRNMYIENSRVEDVSISEKSYLSGSTFKNVKFKNFKSINDNMRSYFSDSVFIDCEFVNCRFNRVDIGKEYRDCKFENCKFEKVTFGKVFINCKFTECKIKFVRDEYVRTFENVIFKDTVIEEYLVLEDCKNVQFINCLMMYSFEISGKTDNILIQNLKGGDELRFEKGVFSNISIIDCKEITIEFLYANLDNLLIKDSKIFGLYFDHSNVGGENKIENSTIFWNEYGKTKIRDLTITNCRFMNHINLISSELIRLKLNNNTYKDGIKHNVWNEKYTDSDKFPLKSVTIPEEKVPDIYFDTK